MNAPTLREEPPIGWKEVLIGLALGLPLIAVYIQSEGERDGLLRGVTWLLMVGALALPKGRWQNILGLAALTYGVWSAAMIIRTNFLFPHEWDFYCIYLDSKAAWLGLNPIRPENYSEALAAMNAPIQHSEVFAEEILEVGMKYFPSALLVFAPLGALSYQTAHVVWVLVNWIALLGGIQLLHTYLREKDLPTISFPLLVGLVLLWPASKPTIHFENSHMLCFGLVMLLWRDRHKTRGALWVVIGTLFKPFFVLLAPYFMMRRDWKALGLVMGGIVLSWLLIIPIWGVEPIQDFFFNNPNGRVPTFQYTSKINHSLLSVLVRAVDFDFSLPYGPTRMPLFLLLGGMVGMVSALICWLSPRLSCEWHLAAVLGMAVLLYPGSLKPYSLLLLPVFLLQWRNPVVLSSSLWMLLSGGIMFFMIRYAFWTNLWLWAICLISMGIYLSKQEKPWKNVGLVRQTSNFR